MLNRPKRSAMRPGMVRPKIDTIRMVIRKEFPHFPYLPHSGRELRTCVEDGNEIGSEATRHALVVRL